MTRWTQRKTTINHWIFTEIPKNSIKIWLERGEACWVLLNQKLTSEILMNFKLRFSWQSRCNRGNKVNKLSTIFSYHRTTNLQKNYNIFIGTSLRCTEKSKSMADLINRRDQIRDSPHFTLTMASISNLYNKQHNMIVSPVPPNKTLWARRRQVCSISGNRIG